MNLKSPLPSWYQWVKINPDFLAFWMVGHLKIGPIVRQYALIQWGKLTFKLELSLVVETITWYTPKMLLCERLEDRDIIRGPFIYYVSPCKGGGSENCDFCLFSVIKTCLRREAGQKSLKMCLRNTWMFPKSVTLVGGGKLVC